MNDNKGEVNVINAGITPFDWPMGHSIFSVIHNNTNFRASAGNGTILGQVHAK